MIEITEGIEFPAKIEPRRIDNDYVRRNDRPTFDDRPDQLANFRIPVREKELDLYGELDFNLRDPEELLMILGGEGETKIYEWAKRFWKARR